MSNKIIFLILPKNTTNVYGFMKMVLVTSEWSANWQERYVICVVHLQKCYRRTWKQTILAQEKDHIHVIGKTASANINHSPNAKKQSVIFAPTQV